MRRTSVLTVLFLLLSGLGLLVSPAQAFVDKDCSDFATQAQAQQYLTAGDPHRLDADGDGKACDSLPCPCSSGTQTQTTTTTTSPTIRQYGRVIRVIDGDTADVRLRSGVRKRVRFLGINAPETYQCYGGAATRATRGILPVGTAVKLVSDPTQARTDRYGRLLRYVSKGTVDVSRRLLYRGAARVYVYNNKPFKRISAYRYAQRQAMAAPRGLWRVCR